MMAKEASLSAMRGFLYGALPPRFAPAPLAAAPNMILPVPVVTIYPGDTIQDPFWSIATFPAMRRPCAAA